MDGSWSGDGVKTVDNAKITDWADAPAADSADRVLLCTDTNRPAHLCRFTATGQSDSSFSGDGLAKFQLMADQGAFPLAIGAPADGPITVAAANLVGKTLFGAARFTSHGRLDSSYGDQGVVAARCSSGCLPTWGDVQNGRVAIFVDASAGIQGTGDVSEPHGSTPPVRHQATVFLCISRNLNEDAYTIAVDGGPHSDSRTSRSRAYVARLPYASPRERKVKTGVVVVTSASLPRVVHPRRISSRIGLSLR